MISDMHDYLAEMWRGLGGNASVIGNVECMGEGELPSVFAVSDFAAAAIGAAGASVAELISERFGSEPRVVVDRRLALLWHAFSIRPQGWELPAP